MTIPRRALAPALATATLLGSIAVAPVVAPAVASADASADAGAAPVPTTERFTIATFNVLGGSHGSRRSIASRTSGAVRYLSKHHVSLVGLQEFEGKQQAAFLRATNGRWTVVGAPSRSGRSLDPRNSIAFQRSRFTLVSRSSLSIPYFHGDRVNMPVATLRSRTTGRTFVVINTHNPADVHGSAQRYRNRATARQVALVRRLRAKGTTVFVTGDMNEKKGYFCKMTRSGTMHSASGGSVGGRCTSPKVNGIDWIFGSRDVTFSNWLADTSTRSSGVSDHPLVVAGVTLSR